VVIVFPPEPAGDSGCIRYLALLRGEPEWSRISS
jgi:hypothetical protein